MFGPAGAAGAAGGEARPAGTNGHSSAELSISQPHPPTIVFSAPSTPRVAAVAMSRMCSSMRVSRVMVKARRFPSGEKPTSATFEPAGRNAPFGAVADRPSVMPVPAGRRRGPLFAGSMREPARPSHGRASSAIDGMDWRGTSAMTSRSGLTATPGSGSASINRRSPAAASGMRASPIAQRQAPRRE